MISTFDVQPYDPAKNVEWEHIRFGGILSAWRICTKMSVEFFDNLVHLASQELDREAVDLILNLDSFSGLPGKLTGLRKERNLSEGKKSAASLTIFLRRRSLEKTVMPWNSSVRSPV